MEFPVLKHKANLTAQAHPGLPKDVLFTVPELLSVEECQACIDYAEGLGFSQQGSRGPAYGEAFRDNGRVSVQDESISNALWHSTGLSGIFRSLSSSNTGNTSGTRSKGSTSTAKRMAGAVGCNPNIRFYRYTPGQRFGKHIDESVDLEDGSHTRYTLLVYLSGSPAHANGAGDQRQSEQGGSGGRNQHGSQQADGGGSHAHASDTKPSKRAKGSPAAGRHSKGSARVGNDRQDQQGPCTAAVQDLVGGETRFYDGRRLVASITPAPGLALLHLHGDECLEHEALPVVRGTKYVLRSDVVFSA